MQTQYFNAVTQKENGVRLAGSIIRSGGLVAFPTETVYGLGANGLDPAAVEGIFRAKGRPSDNPLILHVAKKSDVKDLWTRVPEEARLLMDAFWPGPLTLIFNRSSLVPDQVAAGLPTVAVRMPDHKTALALIRAAGVPIAAPSANLSGRPSPTTAQHMLEDMDGKIDAIVDGGPCTVGVESTIIDLTVMPPRLLRPGGVTLEELRETLGEVAVDPAVRRLMGEGEHPRAPGMKYRHYAPKAPVTVVRGDPARGADYIRTHLEEGDGVACFDEFAGQYPGHVVERLGPAGDKAAQARHVFDALRAFDDTDVSAIWAQCPDDAGIGLAVANRLSKAAGFHIINVDEMGR